MKTCDYWLGCCNPILSVRRIRRSGSVIDSFRAPVALLALAKAKAKASDLTFSQLMRRALKRELEGAR